MDSDQQTIINAKDHDSIVVSLFERKVWLSTHKPSAYVATCLTKEQAISLCNAIKGMAEVLDESL